MPLKNADEPLETPRIAPTGPAGCASLVVVHLLGPFSVLAADYEQARSTAARSCEAIDPAAHQSGLLFNPDGYRSYYVRSKCFQEAAVQFRDLRLCAAVNERRALFSSSWGYSAGRCRELVAEGIASDTKALEDLKRLYAGGGVTLRGFQIQRNGNGVDSTLSRRLPERLATATFSCSRSSNPVRAGRPS